MPPGDKKVSVRLNVADFIYMCMEDVIPSQGNLLTLRFGEPHDPQEIKDAMRLVVGIYPRLRAVVEPCAFSYRLRILDDRDPRVETGFENSFRVTAGVSPDSLEYVRRRRNLYNEPFALSQPLLLRMRYFPDDPRPVLLLSPHHVTGDGSSCLHMLGTLMSLLNEKSIESALEVTGTSLVPALWPRPFDPRAVLAAFAGARPARGGSLVHASTRPADFFGPVDIFQHSIAGFDEMKVLAKRSGTSLTTLVLACLSDAVGRDREGDVVMIVSADLRPFYPGKAPVFGNHVTGFPVVVPAGEKTNMLVGEINGQMRENIGRIRRKEAFLPMAFHKVLSLAGRKHYAGIVRLAKSRGALAKSFALANLGKVDALNSFGTRATLCFLDATGPSHGLFVAMNVLDKRINLSFTFQRAEFDRDEIRELAGRFDDAVADLVRDVRCRAVQGGAP